MKMTGWPCTIVIWRRGCNARVISMDHYAKPTLVPQDQCVRDGTCLHTTVAGVIAFSPASVKLQDWLLLPVELATRLNVTRVMNWLYARPGMGGPQPMILMSFFARRLFTGCLS